MARLCILHTGLYKTGTSSLQNFLAVNADRLLDAGVLYPVRNVSTRRYGNNHIALVRAIEDAARAASARLAAPRRPARGLMS
jgi:hypothetical protein